MALTIPNSFTTSTVIVAADVNADFTAVKTFVDAIQTGVNIDSGAITAAKLATDAVTTVKILDANVTAAKLASTAVTAGAYTNASVTVDAQGRLTAASSGTAATAADSDQIVLSSQVFG